MIACGLCERTMQFSMPRDRDRETRLLNPEDYCGWCARPVSDSAKARAPRLGFLKVAQALGERRPAIPRGVMVPE